MMNPITVQEISKANRFELDKKAEAYQVINEASRLTERNPSLVGRARVFIGMALIRAGERLAHQQVITPEVNPIA
jgi:hypothetical protein